VRACVDDQGFCTLDDGGCPAIIEFIAFPPTQYNLNLYALNCCEYRIITHEKEEEGEQRGD